MAFTYGVPVGPKILGVDLDGVHSSAQHPVGTVVWDSKGKSYVYVLAGGSIGAGNFVKGVQADDPFTDVVIGTASAAANRPIGMATQALVDNDYAFILRTGVFEDDAQIVSANVAAGDPIVSDANGDGDKAAATDINDASGICLVDDGDNTGTVLLW